jgi:uncharacterized MAPEG superfamily protein
MFGLALAAVFTGAMWIPYVLARIGTCGLWAALDNPTARGDEALPAWAQRARRAHANAVENLCVLAAVVTAAAWANPGAEWVGTATGLYVAARLVHFVSYTLGIPVVRTLAFAAGFLVQLAIGLAALAPVRP